VQADATTYPLDGFNAYHGSAPCQDHSPLAALVGEHGTGWMLAHTRQRFEATGKPWVLENVPGAPMRADMLLCGKMFGLRVKRHRQFEISPDLVLLSVPPHSRHRTLTATRERVARWEEGWDISVTGDVGTYLGPEAMGIDWMTGNELSQAIPPAYTEFIGHQLLEHITERAA
jgi:DNA (cytosine-5)-methyltransferase 1